MLVVSRKHNASITIAPADGVDPSLTLRDTFGQGPIVLTVTHVGPRHVRFVIEAPHALEISQSQAGSPCGKAQGPLQRAAVMVRR